MTAAFARSATGATQSLSRTSKYGSSPPVSSASSCLTAASRTRPLPFELATPRSEAADGSIRASRATSPALSEYQGVESMPVIPQSLR